MNMLVVNGQLYSRSTGARSTTLVPVLQKVIFLHDNARPYVAKPVKTYLENIKWDILSYAPYSPDLALSDYFLFRDLIR